MQHITSRDDSSHITSTPLFIKEDITASPFSFSAAEELKLSPRIHQMSVINLSPRGWDLRAAYRASRGRCPGLHTSAPGRSSARCGPDKWPPTGGAGGGGPTAAPGSWLLGCPADRPPGGGEDREEGVRKNTPLQTGLLLRRVSISEEI